VTRLSSVRPSACPGRYEGGEEREWRGEDEEDDALPVPDPLELTDEDRVAEDNADAWEIA
jgi:hypothetical protein